MFTQSPGWNLQLLWHTALFLGTALAGASSSRMFNYIIAIAFVILGNQICCSTSFSPFAK